MKVSHLHPERHTDPQEMSNRVRLIAEKLRARSQTLAFAESCTGGLVAACFAAESGVSDVFQGAIVAYSNDVKFRVLRVPESTVRQLGAVSTTTALAMARGVRDVLGTNWAASITGIAGPTGGTPQKPVGTVCFAVVGPGLEWVSQRLFAGDRNAVQKKSAEFLLDALENALTGCLNSTDDWIHERKSD
jgi:PncC family amidohydrolase